MKPSVSIIIPVFNVENYLRQCLDSVINQTLKEIEIICVNDGSTDSCEEILNEYAIKDSRIKTIHKQNTGYGNSMNVGLKAAIGEYIGIVESDDFIEPTMFETLYNKAKQFDVDLVRSSFNMVYTNNKEKLQISKMSIMPMFAKHGEPFKKSEISTEELYQLYSIKCIWTGIYSADFMRTHNIYFNETPGASYQDTSFLFQILFSAEKMIYIDNALYNYRIDNPSASMKNKGKLTAINDEYNFMYPFMKKHENAIPDIVKHFYQFWVRESSFQFKRISDELVIEFVHELSKFIKLHQVEIFKIIDEFEKPISALIKQILDNPSFVIERINKYKRERDIFFEEISSKLKSEKAVIYGAGKVANSFFTYLETNWLGCDIDYFAVTKLNEKTEQKSLHNIPIIEIEQLKSKSDDYFIIIAVGKDLMLEMEENIKRLGFKNYITYDEIRNHLDFYTAYKTLLGE